MLQRVGHGPGHIIRLRAFLRAWPPACAPVCGLPSVRPSGCFRLVVSQLRACHAQCLNLAYCRPSGCFRPASVSSVRAVHSGLSCHVSGLEPGRRGSVMSRGPGTYAVHVSSRRPEGPRKFEGFCLSPYHRQCRKNFVFLISIDRATWIPPGARGGGLPQGS
jgi:hypothetical protein